MKAQLCFVCYFSSALLVTIIVNAAPQSEVEKKMDKITKTLGALARQMMLQQLAIEESQRSFTDSGVKQVRHSIDGTRNYHADTHSNSWRLMAIHDHSNNERTVGMGEFVGILNGVEFRTRHNDYGLRMPSRSSSKWHAIENLPFPDVPPEVLAKPTVQEQIVEMREWFKAWKAQYYRKRDYRKYFKPVICYLEGAWTKATSGSIDEPFESDRHFIDASSWFDLQEKIRFTSYTGRKDNLENFAYLPTGIMNIINETYPEFAQWNYRILCSPINFDLPLNRFRVVDELAPRITSKRTYQQHSMTRSARFQLNPFEYSRWQDRLFWRKYGLLDKIMAQVPGKDNYAANLNDTAFDMTAYSLADRFKKIVLNAGYYHRWFKVERRGAMGTSTRHRGFADENLFMAMTTQPKVAGTNLRHCTGRGKYRKCVDFHQKWTYAIPLEIIYLTPLSKWNPYDLEYKGYHWTKPAKTVTAGGRNGGKTKEKAYNGSHTKLFYRTPVEFFSGAEVGADAADTTKGSVGVLDKSGNVRICVASGTRIFLPNIPGVGILRQRYPIMPVAGEGTQMWKELEATKDALLKSKTYGYAFREPLQSGPPPTDPPRLQLTLEMQDATNPKVGAHRHDVHIDERQLASLNAGRSVPVTSGKGATHSHTITVKMNSATKEYYIERCDASDAKDKVCWDKHPRKLKVKNN